MRILIVGGGQVGTLIARRLVGEGNEVVIVEPDDERCRQLEELLDAKIVCGSAASIETLHEAGLAETEMLIAVSNQDEVNVLACLVAQVESRVRIKVARMRTHEIDHWRRVTEKAGLKIDLIIHPESHLARRIMRVMRMPGVSDIVDFAEGRIRLFGMNVEKDSWLVGKTLEELDAAGPPANSLIAMIFRGQQVIIPHGSELLLAGDHVYTIGTREHLDDVVRFMGLEARESLERVFIVGGKQIGIRVAELLETQGVRVKLFERDQRRSERIASILKDTVVIHGDGTDQAALIELFEEMAADPAHPLLPRWER